MKKVIFTILLLSPLLTLAQGTQNPGGGTQNPGTPAPVNYKIEIKNPLANKVDNIPALLNLIIKEIINPIAAVVAVLVIMYAGFLYVTAQGNQTKIAAAHQALLYAAIGSAILLGANLIATAIQSTVTQLGT